MSLFVFLPKFVYANRVYSADLPECSALRGSELHAYQGFGDGISVAMLTAARRFHL